MSGKPVKFEWCSFAQRACIRKLEQLNGWEAVTITKNGNGGWIDVIFDTGPRRMDFASTTLCTVGWSVTADDVLGKRILTDEEFDSAREQERSRLARKRSERLAA